MKPVCNIHKNFFIEKIKILFLILWFALTPLMNYKSIASSSYLHQAKVTLILLAILLFIFSKINKRLFLLLSTMLVIYLINIVFSHQGGVGFSSIKLMGLFIIFALLDSLSAKHFRLITKSVCIYYLILAIVIILGVVLFHIFPNSTIDRHRYSFGFRNANFLPMYIVTSVILFFLMRKYFLSIISLFILGINFIYSHSKSSVIFLSIFALFYFVFLFILKQRVLRISCGLGILVISLLFSLFPSYLLLLEPSIDTIFSLRLSYLENFYSTLSTWTYLLGGGSLQSDNVYFSIINGFGIFGLAIYIIQYIFILIKITDKQMFCAREFSFFLSLPCLAMVENIWSPFLLLGVIHVSYLLGRRVFYEKNSHLSY